MVGILAVKIVVAEANEGSGNFAKVLEPGSEATKFVFGIDAVERIDEVAGNQNVIWFLCDGLNGDGAESLSLHFATKMDVANHEKVELMFKFGLIKSVTTKVKAVHVWKLLTGVSTTFGRSTWVYYSMREKLEIAAKAEVP